MKLITRDGYIDKLESVKDVPDIKVITGVRRSGKSMLLDSFSNLCRADMNANVVRVNLNQRKYRKLLDPDSLYDHIPRFNAYSSFLKMIINPPVTVTLAANTLDSASFS